MRVFLVDDSQPFRAALKQVLAQIPGLNIVGEAEDALDAIDGILASPPDLVLLDLVLRTGTGLRVLTTVRRRCGAVRVFVLTNNAAPQYRERCLTAGAHGFFDKSSDLDACVAACRALAIGDS